ncbi:adenylate/guanylate cyclase domain-containing protein [Micromonospora lupini]|uniref:adenylate/guanylate cyclase domain-containing protein n=1 Tax=Micromonospora lupini TaxID=285679 RepID=UPI00224D979E|nr:adenylate/guanylate cyclase domain-containing protein [Micromonospora lupini]MCX5067700.1 adenylate/guanylate cyclase domain-containing protein [Micromonospora lupini]
MDGKYRPYNYLASIERIDGYLKQPRGNFEEVDELPDRDRLTYTNGFHAQWCSALFVDIRDSSKLPDVYTRPALAKIYRAYISEMVAILSGVPKVHEVNIVGDGVWGVFNSSQKSDNDEVFSAAFKINSLLRILNHKMKTAGYETPIRVGIGVADGRALMIKAGFNGSGIHDVVYMGQVVNRAAKLASQGSKGLTPPIVLDEDFVVHLNGHNADLVHHDRRSGWYTSDAVSAVMDEWADENCL